MDENIDTSKSTSRTEFSATKPLPPIGTTNVEADTAMHSGSMGTDISDDTNRDEDQKSNYISTAIDRRRESRPLIVRGYRPETMSDEEMENELAQRSVSFTNGPPVTSRRRTYDGREITFVTLNTQTDWDWVERAEIANTNTSDDNKKVGGVAGMDKASASPRSATSKTDVSEERIAPDTLQYQMPYSDEYGIPILDLSSDTDDSSDEEVSHNKMIDERTFLPSVGPPSILQYQRESEKQEIVVDDPESRRPNVDDPKYDKDDSGIIHGMFSGNCEFCNKPIKCFPTVEQQLKTAPEILYCCDEYREFVEFIFSTTNQMEEEQQKEHKLIDIKPHEHIGSKQERNAAKEKAVQRMRERELQRRQQEASGMQQNFFASGHGGKSKAGFMKIPGGPGGAGGHGNVTMTNMYVARQMKTINYQLSSQKCLEEGWTLRAPSPLADEDGDDVFIPEALNPAMLADGKLRDRPLIEKFYESGQKFLTMFPDGTGNVFYPSGNLAILVSSIKLGQYYYTLHQDLKRSGVAAVFEPNGYGYCYFQNGDIRLYIDQYGGIELDNFGSRRRKWSWKDQVTHVHAPPFQPICIGVNRHMGVRVMSQENIAVTFSASRRSCRFNMGSRLKLVAPENAPLKEVEEEYIFLEEKKNLVDSLLDKVANLLKFPNNPKLDKMLPPLHITSKHNKTEKLKKERQIYLAQQSAREKKQPSLTVN